MHYPTSKDTLQALEGRVVPVTRLRDRARAIKALGASQRGVYDPSPDSSHYKVYRWWRTKTNASVERENFCHYWRVVIFWAPLRWLRVPLQVLAALIALAAAVWLIVMFGPSVLDFVLGVLMVASGAGYLICSFKATGHMIYEVCGGDFGEFENSTLSGKPRAVRGIVFLVASPVAIVLAALAVVLGSIVYVLISLHEDQDAYCRALDWFVEAHPGDSKWVFWIRPWLSIPAAIGVLSFWYEWARAIVISFAIGLGACILVVAVAFTVSVVRERQRRREAERVAQARLLREQQMDRFLGRLFDCLHPAWQSNTYRKDRWLQRYDTHCMKWHGRTRHELNVELHLQYATERYGRRFGDLQSLLPPRQVVPVAPPPRKLRLPRLQLPQLRWGRSFLRGTGDMFVLLWSIVLVKKWKSCPLMDLPD